jgi:hypothetical protein
LFLIYNHLEQILERKVSEETSQVQDEGIDIFYLLKNFKSEFYGGSVPFSYSFGELRVQIIICKYT